MMDSQKIWPGLFFLFLCGGLVWTQQEDASFQSLVEAERSFARYSVAHGVRDAFMKFFSDEGIVFRPNPLKYKEAMKKVPPPENPLAVTLDWQPIVADVSQDGALGYTTGPFTLTDNTAEKKPARHGYYFTVWKKQSDGQWNVALDLGIQTGTPFTGDRQVRRASAKRPPQLAGSYKQSSIESSLGAGESEFLRDVKTEGYRTALSLHLADESRLYRQNLEPFVGRDTIERYFSPKKLMITWEIQKAETASSADLGYTYGSYTQSELLSDSTIIEQGYFARVWRRELDNKWRIVFDVTSPVQPSSR
ncbi:MAG: nuclear transport factor 2 family protein [bacterium]